MNRLQLCQKVHRILRIDQNLPGTAPTTTTGQTGVLNEIVKMVDDAYQTIQSAESWWGFRLLQGTFPITDGVRTYTRATIQGTLTTFDEFLVMSGLGPDHLLIHLTATGVADQSPCWYVPYQDWRGFWDRGERSEGKPVRFTIRQDQTIEFDSTPDASYTVTTDYRRTLHEMTADAHEPLFAADFHDAVVWGAVKAYTETREASQLYQLADRNFSREMAKLRFRYLPRVSFCTTLLWGHDP